MTGAGQGIGRSTAQAVAEEGAHVVVTDIHESVIAETAELVEGTGQRALPLVVDVTDAKAVGDAIKWLKDSPVGGVVSDDPDDAG